MRASLQLFPAWIPQAARFLTVGLLNTALDAAIYYTLTRGFPVFSHNPALAKAISYSVGVINSFFWNRLWTFRSNASLRATLLPYAAVNLCGLALNAGMLQISLKVLGIPEGLAFILATGLSTSWNFLASKLLVFRRTL
jgi:putative flippase GtrA